MKYTSQVDEIFEVGLDLLGSIGELILSSFSWEE